MKSMKEIYLAGGCFWGTEHFLKQIEGVEVREIGDYSLFTLYQTLDETIIYIVDGNDGVVGSIGASYDEDVKIDFREVR